MKRLAQRFLIAAVAFSSAAVWNGLNLVGALECLIAFAIVYAVAGAMQGGRARLERRHPHEPRSRSRRPARDRPKPPPERSSWTPDSERRRRSTLRSPDPLFDRALHGGNDWAGAADRGW